MSDRMQELLEERELWRELKDFAANQRDYGSRLIRKCKQRIEELSKAIDKVATEAKA